jgi:hypothetical protein
MSYRVTDYTEGCENHILPLFNTAFKRELPREQWEWRFKKNPYGGPFIACIWDDSRLVGHTAVTPLPAYYKGERIMAGYSGTSMGHPGYVGTLPLAVKTLVERNPGLEFIYAFPNKNSCLVFKKLLKWANPGEVFSMAREPWEVESCKYIRRIDAFGKRHSRLINRLAARYDFMVCRDEEYLGWRFTHKPNSGYQCYEYEKDDEVKGFTVLNTYEDPTGTHGQIIDIIAPELDVFEALVNHASYLFYKNTSIVKLWMTAREYVNKLEEMGFKPTGNAFPITIWPCEKSRDLCRMYLTMGDSDVF